MMGMKKDGNPNTTTSTSAGSEAPSTTTLSAEPPQYLTLSGSFQSALHASSAEPANLNISHEDACFRSRQGGYLLPPAGTNEKSRRVSMNRSNIIDTIVTDEVDLFTNRFIKSNEELGKGSYGAVQKVVERLSGRTRAMKTVPKPDSKIFIRLQREILIMKRLDHPSIIRLYSVYEDEEKLYFMMELCTGGELFDRIVSAKALKEKAAASVLKQLLSALAYAHSNHIMHRDVKPENILFVSKGNDEGPIKLIDWGFSAKYTPGQKFQSVVGTPFYVAPEVLGQYYDYRCDMWSAGVLLYIMLSGAPPFFGADNKAILKCVSKGRYEMSRPIWKGVSGLAKDLVKALLRKDPTVRFTAPEALSHPWFKMLGISDSKIAINSSNAAHLYTNFRRFHKMNLLVRLAMTCIAHMLDYNDTEKARDYFYSFDEDGDGVLTISEIIKTLRSTGIEMNDIHDYLESIDTDGNGTIDFTEWVAVFLQVNDMQAKPELIRAAFVLMGGCEQTNVLTYKSLSKVITGMSSANEAKDHALAILTEASGKMSSYIQPSLSYNEFLKLLEINE